MHGGFVVSSLEVTAEGSICWVKITKHLIDFSNLLLRVGTATHRHLNCRLNIFVFGIL